MERAESVPAPGERRFFDFGDFRVDPVRRRLLRVRDNEPVAVTSKSFSLLVVLLEHRGQVVEKEELFRRVWPDTYVTEANLTQNVSSLRKALGERAGDRRFIVTVPGRGYSFVADVREVTADSSGAFSMLREAPAPVLPFPSAAAGPVEPEAPEAEAPEEPPQGPESRSPESRSPESRRQGSGSQESRAIELPPEPAAQPRRMRRPVLVLSGTLLLALAAVSLLLWRPGAPVSEGRPPESESAAASHRPAVAVLGLKDLAGRPETAWLGTALSEMLTTELSAGGQARLIPGDLVARTRQSLSIPDTENLRAADLERLRATLGADFVVVGSYLVLDQQGSRQIRLDLQVKELPTGTEVTTVSETGRESDLFEILSRAGTQLRQALGLDEPLPGQARAAQTLHPSVPEAARLTAQGLERLRAFDAAGARPFLERAAEIEPGSAAIHSILSRIWYELGDDARSLQEARLALDLSRSLPRDERLAAEARFFAAGKQWPQAAEIYRSLWTFFPDDIEHGLQLATVLISGGRIAEALEVLNAVRRLPAGKNDARIDLEEARAAARFGDMPNVMRAAEAAEAKARRSGERHALARALIWQGVALLDEGQPAKAVSRFREAEGLARAVGHPWTEGMALSNLGRALQSLGDLDEAELRHRQSLDIARSLGTALGVAAQLYTLALLHRDRGEFTEALRLLREAQMAYVEVGDRLMQGRALAGMAPILLRQGDFEGARRCAEEAVAAAREVGNRGDQAQALEILASTLSWQGDLSGSHRQLETALRLLVRFKRPTLATGVLGSSSDVLARLGDFDLARRRLDQAIAVEQRSGDKMAGGLLLGARARFALRSGDVEQARALSEDLIRQARQTGARGVEAWALRQLGAAQKAAGDLPAARASYMASLRESSAVGDEAGSTVARLELARLAPAAGEAESMARSVADWAETRGSSWLEAQARAVETEALLRQGRIAEAVKVSERLRELAGATRDRELIVLTAPALALADAAAGDVDGAVLDLREVIAQAEASKLVVAARDARRALKEIEARGR